MKNKIVAGILAVSMLGGATLFANPAMANEGKKAPNVTRCHVPGAPHDDPNIGANAEACAEAGGFQITLNRNGWQKGHK